MADGKLTCRLLLTLLSFLQSAELYNPKMDRRPMSGKSYVEKEKDRAKSDLPAGLVFKGQGVHAASENKAAAFAASAVVVPSKETATFL